MLAQFRQHRSRRVAERMRAHAGDANAFERGPDLSLQDRGQIERPCDHRRAETGTRNPWVACGDFYYSGSTAPRLRFAS